MTDESYKIFLEEAEKCEPPLEDEELQKIWHSASKFAKKIQSQEGYVSPEVYNKDFNTLKPPDYSDIGQAKALTAEYCDELKYTSATDYIRYDGKVWIESRQQAVGAMEEFLDLQDNIFIRGRSLKLFWKGDTICVQMMLISKF